MLRNIELLLLAVVNMNHLYEDFLGSVSCSNSSSTEASIDFSESKVCETHLNVVPKELSAHCEYAYLKEQTPGRISARGLAYL
jgi:hypothetical protein